MAAQMDRVQGLVDHCKGQVGSCKRRPTLPALAAYLSLALLVAAALPAAAVEITIEQMKECLMAADERDALQISYDSLKERHEIVLQQLGSAIQDRIDLTQENARLRDSVCRWQGTAVATALVSVVGFVLILLLGR